MLESLSQVKAEIVEESMKPKYRTELKGFIMQKTGLRSDREIGQALGGYCNNLVQGIMSGRLYPSKILQRQLCRLLGISLGELRQML